MQAVCSSRNAALLQLTLRIVRKLLWMLLVLWGITLISFWVIHLAPGSPTDMETTLNPLAGEAARQRLEALYGLDKPLHVQYLDWLSRLVRLDFGLSMSADGRPVLDKIMERLPLTVGMNVILAPIFIFWLEWGIRGAAVATVAGQVITAAMGVWYLCHTKALRLGKDDFKLRGKILAAYLPLGLCSFLAQISLVIAMAATNNMLVQYGAGSKYGADIPLTVLGIVMKVFQIIISITIGMSAGCIPIVGYNYGAEQCGRCRGILWRLMGAEFALGVLALLVTQLFPRQLIGLFGAESALYNEFAVLTFRVYLCMLPLATVNKAAFIFMQALGRPVESAGLSFFREVLLAVPLVLLLPRAFGLMGVLYSMPAADIVTFLASAFVLVRTDRQLRK